MFLNALLWGLEDGCLRHVVPQTATFLARVGAIYLQSTEWHAATQAEMVSTEKSRTGEKVMLPPWLSLGRILREGGFLQGKWPHHTFHTAYLVSIMDSTLYRASDQPAWTPRAKPQQNKASSPSSIPTGPEHQLVNLKAICTNMLFPRNMCFLKQCCRLCLLGSWIYLSVNYSKSVSGNFLDYKNYTTDSYLFICESGMYPQLIQPA